MNTRTGLPNCANCNKLKAYGPFGENLLPDTLGATTDTAINASDATMGWAASPSRKIDGTFSIPLIQMGARVYLPTLGRFLQVDPVEGGTLNPYVYAHDPLNMNDYSGQFVMALPLFFVAPIAWGAVAEAALWTAAAGTAIYAGSKAGDSYKNSRSTSKSQSKAKPVPLKPQPYKPTTKPGLNAINQNTTALILQRPTGIESRAVLFTTAQLHTGIKPISASSGLPIFAPPGYESIMKHRLHDPRYGMMSKYAYNYFDVPTGKSVEIHYNIDELAREYADLKVVQ